MQKPFDLAHIIATLRRLLPRLARQYHVQSLAVVGSYVHHAQRPGSDLDVLVTFDDSPGLLKFVELENYLSDALGVKVDLVMREALKPAIGERILRALMPVGPPSESTRMISSRSSRQSRSPRNLSRA